MAGRSCSLERIIWQHVIEGLNIFAKKSSFDEGHIGGADHDVIFGAPLNIELSEGEIKILQDHNWFTSKLYDSWCIFV